MSRFDDIGVGSWDEAKRTKEMNDQAMALWNDEISWEMNHQKGVMWRDLVWAECFGLDVFEDHALPPGPVGERRNP